MQQEGDSWQCLPQQDVFGQVLRNLNHQDKAAANLVSRAWHAGIHERLSSLLLLPIDSIPPATLNDLSRFRALTSIEIRYMQPFAASTNRKQEVAATLSTLPLRTLWLQDVEAAPSDYEALGILTGLHELVVYAPHLHRRTQQDLTLLPALSELTALRTLNIMDSRERDLAVLKRMPNLQDLTIGLHPDAALSTMSCLRQLTRLHLSAASAAQRRQLTALTGLRVLDGLQLGEDRDVSYLPAMAALTNLSLSCHGLGTNRVDLAGLGTLRRLKTLAMYRVTDGMDLKPLSGLTALRSLEITGRATVDVEFITSLNRLTELVTVTTRIRDSKHLSHPTMSGRLRWLRF